MRVRIIALLVCLVVACFSAANAQDQTVITNGLTQIAKELCKDDSGLFYFPDGLGWQVYPLNYWQPMWIDFSEYPSLQDLKSRAIASTNRCALGQVFYGVQPLHVTVTLNLFSGDLILSPGCSSEVLATNSAPAGYQTGQWPVDCRVVERLWQQWQSVQSDPDWQEWYGPDAKPFLTVHFQLADLINDKPTYEANLAAETAAWEEFVMSGGAMITDSEESGGMSMMMQGDPCDTNEFTILDIQTDEQGRVTVGWCAASNVVYQIQVAPEMLTNTAWEAQALYVGEGYASWTDTNAPAFPYRFYRCRALPGNEDADGDGLSNMAEVNLGTGIDNPDADGDGITDGDEVNVHGTDPLNPDSDNDFWLDGAEVLQGYNPTNSANFPDFGFTVNGGADVVTNAQLHIDLAAGLIADYTIISEDITFTSSITNMFASSFDHTLGNTNDGMHMVFLILLKASGTTSPQFGHTIELDTHAPTISITSPSNGVVVSHRRIDMEGFAADAATNPPQLDASRPLLVTINGAPANDRGTNGSWWVGPQDLVPGTNAFVAVATDRAGFVVSNSVWFIYDATLATNVPVFTVDVTNTITVASNATTIAVSGTIDDDNATVQIVVVDAADPTITNATVDTAVHGTNWWGEVPVVPGSNIIVVTAQNAGSLPATNSFTVIQDTNVFLVISGPSANSAINTSAVTVVGIASTNFDGAITINGSAASTSLTSSGIVFSGTVPINNVDANVIEVTATGTDGSSAAARQIVYGYEVVAFKYRYWYTYEHVRDDCWYSHHYPTNHYDHGDYYMEESWAAPAAELTGWDDSHEWGFSGPPISSFSDSWTAPWRPDRLPTADTGRIEYYSYRDGKRLHPTYQIDFGFRDGSGFPAECSCQNTYCEGEPTDDCWIDSEEEMLDVEIGSHETTFIKHWPRDEEQSVILHFKDFYYYDRDTDVTKISLWGQPGLSYDVEQRSWGVWTNVGFLVKIRTNTRYTLRETDFAWPHTPENATWHSPNAQSINRYYEDWHAFYYNSFASTNVTVKITRTDPDIGVLCAGCTMQFYAETTPPNREVVWSIPSDETGAASISTNGLLTIGSNAANGNVRVRVADKQAPKVYDERSVFAFVPAAYPGIVDLGVVGQGHGSVAEIEIGILHPFARRDLFRARDLAFTITSNNFPNAADRWDGAIGNAFQHAYASCLAAQSVRSDLAKQAGDAHEQYSQNQCNQASMDFHNNAVGRTVGCPTCDCEQQVLAALAQGKLRWIKDLPQPPAQPPPCPRYQSEQN